jgi:hypothetical protein
MPRDDPRYVGVDLRYPEVGEHVTVKEGPLEGQEVDVVAVTGYGRDKRIVVRTKGDEVLWLWPWNLV